MLFMYGGVLQLFRETNVKRTKSHGSKMIGRGLLRATTVVTNFS